MTFPFRHLRGSGYNHSMTETTYTHPNATFYRFTQWILLAILFVLLLTVPLQIGIALAYPQAFLFFVSALITLVLSTPIILYLTVTPTVSIHSSGITIHPFIGRAIQLDWEQIREVKEYSLLPKESHEVNRRLLVGKKRYQSAEGKMLLIDDLPMIYRVAGFFAGEQGGKIIALSNRTHDNYEHLIKQVMKHTRKTKEESQVEQ